MRYHSAVSLTALAALLLAVSASTSALADDEAEELLGANENPPVVSAGKGEFEVEIEDDRIKFELTYDVASGGSDITQAHIHVQNPGNNGPIVVFLCTNLGNNPMGATQRDCPPSPGEVTGEIVAGDVITAGNVSAGDLEAVKRLLEDGAIYANVHTDAVPSGEIRGQVNPRER